MSESESRQLIGQAIEASRPIPGADLHEVEIRIGPIPSFLAIVGDLNGEGECGLIFHAQTAFDLHVIRGRELLPIHSANGEMSLPILQSLVKAALRQYNPYPHAKLSERDEQIRRHLAAAEKAIADALAIALSGRSPR